MKPLQSLVQSGTRLWLDSIDPLLVAESLPMGATGATSNPVIVADLIGTGRFDDRIAALAEAGLDPEAVAWQLTDQLVSEAESAYLPIFGATQGNDGYVSFELDPLIEDDSRGLDHDARVARYIELGKHWSAGHPNRMIKVPATPAGLDAIGPLAGHGVPLNVTLIFSMRQYRAASAAIFDAAIRAGRQIACKSVYSIFVSRIDLYTEQHCKGLSPEAQGLVGIVNAQTIWRANQEFWQGQGFRFDQSIVFASTGTKKPADPPWKYVAALAGSDIQTNPPATNQAAAASSEVFDRRIDQWPPDEVLASIRTHVDDAAMEAVLMREGLAKFCDPQKKLLALITSRQSALATST